ncbi:MAG: hypothetical protein RMK97_05745 [Sutterellaceae bacterium]|nr:hypothetical protein [Burkholderiaceae bacterium]MCX7900965.1 hypothetical protein [Burkholderiaceae bacterium]MDW8429993.1 hypothetical protein [Sutterellaceae bacterium]
MDGPLLEAEAGAARECAAIAADLERLKAMINEAGDKLAASFATLGAAVNALAPDNGERQKLAAAVTSAVTALQFQDMATQLTSHAQQRLGALREWLRMIAPATDPLAADTRMQPVKQTGLGAGSIDLFV